MINVHYFKQLIIQLIKLNMHHSLSTTLVGDNMCDSVCQSIFSFFYPFMLNIFNKGGHGHEVKIKSYKVKVTRSDF